MRTWRVLSSIPADVYWVLRQAGGQHALGVPNGGALHVHPGVEMVKSEGMDAMLEMFLRVRRPVGRKLLCQVEHCGKHSGSLVVKQPGGACSLRTLCLLTSATR